MEVTSLVVAAAAFAVAYTAEGLPRKMPSIPNLRLPALSSPAAAAAAPNAVSKRSRKVRIVRFAEVSRD
ncbi:hypothetical protein CALCODRAFT_485196 [Calocera cornea HHB12733]|uniref:Uncharacterized protein n=1 Tax=Calocera cornea HHB12733 TaxID=1353952 RepID=A0A165EHF3_9BASI|nr:hypothetical protein CALCODRAFT_485196 [Calocera cornea HHB12733]